MFITDKKFVENRIEIWTSLFNLACDGAEFRKDDRSKKCTYKSDDTNKMR